MKTRRSPQLLAALAVLALAACNTDLATNPGDGATQFGSPQLARTRNATKTTSTTSTTTSVTDTAGPTVASCPTAAYDSASAYLDQWGGTLQIGKFRLTVPAGALTSTVEISMVRPGDGTASVRFHPHGLVFPSGARPVISLNYTGCNTGDVPEVIYVTESLSFLELLPTLDLNPKGKSISAYLDHFSRYAVAW